MSDKVSRRDYCQYRLVSQINYMLTNFVDHCGRLSHDAVNRYLRGEHITPRLIWDNVRAQLVLVNRGYIIFDDMVDAVHRSIAEDLLLPAQRQSAGG